MRLLLFIAATASLMGCKDETISGYADTDAEWRLVELNGDAFPSRATIAFPEKGRVAGKAPCNSYSAAQKAPYPWFEAGPIASTKMACADLAAESAFFTALSQMQIAEASGNTLILSNEAGSEMVFTTDAP